MGSSDGQTKRERVIESVGNGLRTVAEIATAVTLKREATRNILYRLVQVGRLRKHADAWYLPNETIPAAALAQEKEQKPMAEPEKHETTCVGCIRKEFELRDKDRDLANAKAETERFKAEAAQVASATSQVKTLQEELTNLTEQLQTAGTLPTVKDFLTHCESGNCAQHAQEWAEVKKDMAAQFLEGLTPDIVQAKAQELDLIPKKITIKGIESLIGGYHGAA